MSITAERIEDIRNTSHTVTFAQDSRAMEICQQTSGLEDVTAEIGHYTRQSFRGLAVVWDGVHAKLVEDRKSASGSAKGSITASISRIPVTAWRIEDESIRNDWRSARNTFPSKEDRAVASASYKVARAARYASRK